MFIAVLILIALALRALYLQAWLRSSVRIRMERNGPITIEVRRRVGMHAIPPHVCEFPVPREERIRVVRLLGIVLWHNEMSLGLPDSACECFDKIGPQDFDKQFPDWLRLSRRAA
ncbi:hypothetical protein QTI66_13160 [Variovorax sp. J22R133]|uniref:hypothetical protein n=1 Tax=Variovorax brevis TaxID=3053503 RepID=UPI002577B94B|nr:hypothetical protein [Variovorax sp. J22R133]MDM0113101.1 hypothetical protein [Variovorax sp. J22R133]